MEIIKEGIKKNRKILGLTQQAFADRIHVTRCAVGSYEEGRATPPIEVLIRMCRLFGTTLDKFCNSSLVESKPNHELYEAPLDWFDENYQETREECMDILIKTQKDYPFTFEQLKQGCIELKKSLIEYHGLSTHIRLIGDLCEVGLSASEAGKNLRLVIDNFKPNKK